jgi:putative spermidine/putrescine transport system substrate-binding protein
MRRAYYAPFETATGTRVEAVRGGVEPTDLIARMVETGEYAWDLALVSHSAHLQLAGGGFLDPIPIDPPGSDAVPGDQASAHFLGHDVYATVLAYRDDAFAPGRAPRRWADLWDVVAFPGPRALRDHPIDTLEQALLADGVAPERLYPCDLDRAFAALDRLAPRVDLWWERVASAADGLREGRVVMTPLSNARALALREAGAPVAWSWEEALVSLEGWVIPRGAPGAGLARAFLGFATTAERQAEFARRVAHAPTIPAAIATLPPERARLLPLHRDHAAGAILVDQAWWAREKERVLPRFARWRRLIAGPRHA